MQRRDGTGRIEQKGEWTRIGNPGGENDASMMRFRGNGDRLIRLPKDIEKRTNENGCCSPHLRQL
jgi:hypothetical protein